ncbi:MAG: hypothetical protein AVW05_03145 [Hadesarchaea archaeon DG-33]|nr:MAG: hypothetical protein AVW05_03145 [Hadesarchaea archaeon DG-33]
MRKPYLWFFVSLLILAILPTVAADRGMWIPPEVDVYGPGQKAIIAWDGEQEILILSTDVYVSPQSLEGVDGRWAVVSESTHENVWTLTLLYIYRGRPENRGKLVVTPFDQHLLSENIWVLVPSLFGNPSAGIQSLEEVKDGIVWKLKPLEECIPENIWKKIWTHVPLGDGGGSECGGTLEEIFLPEWWSTYVGREGSSLPFTSEKVWALEPLDTKVRSWDQRIQDSSADPDIENGDFAISSTKFTLAGENIEVRNWTLAPLHWSFVKENFQVLEFLPLPSLPEVEKGSFESFAQIQSLIMEHAPEWLAPPTRGAEGRGGVEIVFHERIGAHDVTIVKVTNASEFITWAENFLDNQNVEHGAPPERLGAIVDTYLQRGMNYFVFDLIEVGLSQHSIDPLVYRFQSDFLYYPLEISSLASGSTNITLFTLTHDGIDEQYVSKSIEVRLGFDVSENELQLIDPEIAELFHGSARLTVLTYNGALENLKGDLMLLEEVDQLLAAAWAAAVILIFLGIFAIIYKLSPYYKTGPPS